MTLEQTFLSENASELWLIKSGFTDLFMTGVTVDSDGNQFQIMAQAANATWGEPIPIDVAVQRWMSDGAAASTQGHENREISFRVIIIADTSAELAAGEAALARRSGPCLLSWTPSQGVSVAPTTVFELWTWHLSPDFNTDDENRLARAYIVTATAKPWARSADVTTVQALTTGVSPTTVLVDNCNSTTGWAGTPTGVGSSGGGTAVYAGVHTSGTTTLTLTRSGSVTGFGTTPYLMLDMTQAGGTVVSLSVTIDGIIGLSKVAQLGSVSYWRVGPGFTSFTTLKVSATIYNILNIDRFLTIADVSKTDTIGGVGSNKQLSRSLAVGGSVPTSGSLQIASPSATTLGNCLVYTRPDVETTLAAPALRGYRTSGNVVTPDSTCVSGSHETFVAAGGSAGTITYTIPAAQLLEGTYAIVGRFIFGSAAVMTVTVGSAVTGYSVNQSVVGTVTKLLAAGVQWGVIGTVTLPPQDVPAGSTLNAVLTVSGVATTGSHTLDELYLLDLTHGAVTMVLAGFGSPPFTNLWIDSPDADPSTNRPALFIGTQADRSDAAAPYFSTVVSMGDHDLDPEGAIVFTVTDNVDQAVVSGSFYRRWHSNAGS